MCVRVCVCVCVCVGVLAHFDLVHVIQEVLIVVWSRDLLITCLDKS